MNKKIITKYSILVCAVLLNSYVAFAAQFVIEGPRLAPPDRSPVAVRVYLDAEGKTISGISGSFSFPTELFDIESITTESTIVSLWVKQPVLSDEKYFDGRTHISFEGIFPGGYIGVRSPYYEGVRPGSVFTVFLVPKQKGRADINEVQFNEYTEDASLLPPKEAFFSIEVPELYKTVYVKDSTLKEVSSPSLVVSVERDTLINNNAWYVLVHEREQKSPIQSVAIAESNEYHASLVSEYAWRTAKIPYIIKDQTRRSYIHVKVTYANSTYTMRTIAPVENYQGIPVYSRILISVALVLLVLYLYVIYFISIRKEETVI
jgi:hypothetical protein